MIALPSPLTGANKSDVSNIISGKAKRDVPHMFMSYHSIGAVECHAARDSELCGKV